MFTLLDDLLANGRIESYKSRISRLINKNLYIYGFAIIVNGFEAFIEFDSVIHFNAEIGTVNSSHSISSLKINNKLKTLYCIDNKIPLLRIATDGINSVRTHLLEFIKTVSEGDKSAYTSRYKTYDYLGVDLQLIKNEKVIHSTNYEIVKI